MRETLIIYFHNEKKINELSDSTFVSTIKGIAANRSIPVDSIEQFETLLSYLSPDLEVFVYVHIMGDLKSKNPDKNYEGSSWAIALERKFPACTFYFVTTSSAIIGSIDGRPVYNINELFRMSALKSNSDYLPQKVREITNVKKVGEDVKIQDQKDVDIVIITALYYDELEQIKVAFKIKPSMKFNIGNNVGYYFNYNNYRIIATSQAQMGMVESAILAADCISKFNPRYIIMPGVCGGSESTEFGDIIIPDKIHLFQVGKLKDSGLQKESVDVKIETKILENIKPLEKEIVKDIQKDIKKNVTDRQRFAPFLDKAFSARVAPMACSTMVIDKKDFFGDVVHQIDRKMIAVEMEGYGVARAAEHLVGRTKCLLIKCVMDKTRDKNDAAKEYASYISARFLKKMLEKNIFDHE